MPRLLTIDVLDETERQLLGGQVRRLQELEHMRDVVVARTASLGAWLARYSAREACRGQASIVRQLVDELAAVHGCEGWDAQSLSVPEACPEPWWYVFRALARSGYRM